jgi:hypothetical protein
MEIIECNSATKMQLPGKCIGYVCEASPEAVAAEYQAKFGVAPKQIFIWRSKRGTVTMYVPVPENNQQEAVCN